jgi:hypothetical protein
VASLAGVKDPGQVRKWARGELEPTQPAQQRLRFARDVLHEMESTHSKKVAQAWAISVNPGLGYDSPLKAIREDRFQDTAAAARPCWKTPTTDDPQTVHPEHVTLVPLAGEQYRPALLEVPWPVQVPMQGMGIGRQLGWLTGRLSA